MIIQINKLPKIALNFTFEIVHLNNNLYLIPFDLNPDLAPIKNNIIKVIESDDGLYFTSRSYQQEDSVVEINDVKIGGSKPILIAGPCSVDSLENLDDIAKTLKTLNTPMLRAGAFKPRTSPYSFQGLQQQGLEYLKIVKEKYDLPIVVELTSVEQINEYAQDVDVIQIGSRNMQNFELLKAAGKTQKPVLLKRGFQATIQEFLFSAEYIMSQGNPNVILCERGIRSFEQSYRNVLDINGIIYLRQVTHLPIIIDPSHGTGHDSMVTKATLAGLIAGANGAIVEMHTNKDQALSDKEQTLDANQYQDLVAQVTKLETCFL